jgi:monoamine oxidase
MSLKRKPYGSRKTKTRSIDVIIVGGGIAGLFAGYILKQSSPKTNFVILEKNKFPGGRIHTVDFHGKRFPVGAGIGRDTDTYLKELISNFNIKAVNDIKKQRYSFEPYFSNEQILEIIHVLKSRRNEILPTDNVYSYCLRILGKSTLSKFITMAGYEDFLNEPAREYFEMDNMNVNELFLNFKMFFFDWDKLVHSLIQSIGQRNILTEMTVKEIDMVNLDDSVSSTYFLL